MAGGAVGVATEPPSASISLDLVRRGRLKSMLDEDMLGSIAWGCCRRVVDDINRNCEMGGGGEVSMFLSTSVKLRSHPQGASQMRIHRSCRC